MDRTAAFYSAPSYYRGGGFPVFARSRRQRGGSILGSIARVAMPMLKSLGKAVLGQAVGFAKDVAGDVVEGRNIRASLKQRGLKRLKNTALSGLSTIADQVTRRDTPLGKRQAASHRKQPARKKRRQALF